MEFQNISDKNRDMVNRFLMEQWYSTKMIVRGKEYDLSNVDGIIAMDGNEMIGLVTYIISDQECEIMSLDSLRQCNGIGSRLIEETKQIAICKKCKKLKLITTNDNINAIKFYQKRGFDMAHLYRNALDVSRKLKPEIPLIGDNDIPLRHEIEFEMIL